SALTFTNPLPNAYTLAGSTLLVGNSTTFNGPVGGGAVALTLSGTPILAAASPLAATGTLTLTGFNTYSGATTVSGGTLAISGTGVQASAAYTVNVGGVITVDNTTTNNVNRLPDASTLALNGGTFNFVGTNVANTNSTE